jgi:hypothetical protein
MWTHLIWSGVCAASSILTGLICWVLAHGAGARWATETDARELTAADIARDQHERTQQWT